MHIYNGDLRDISNRKSRSFLQINSCGIQQPVSGQMITYRQKGRCDYHILYVASGKCEITYEGKTHVLKHGFVLYPPHIRQKYIDHENTLRMWIHFTGYDIEEILSEAKLTGGVYSISPSPIFEKMFVQLVAEHNQQLTVSNEKGVLLSLLYTLGKLVNNTDSTNDKINEAVTFITTHYNTEISVAELAASCSLSQSRFMNLFKEQTGMAPHAYQQMLRLKNSMTLLTSTNLNISDICSMSGYHDPLYFSRLFRKQTGVSPRQYRQIHNNPQES